VIRPKLKLVWLLVTATLVLLATFSAPAFSKLQAEPVPETAAPEPERDKTVEEILRQQQDLIEGQRFSYDPQGRRDPFASLFEEVRLQKEGPRPKGVAGMMVSEIDLVGIVEHAAGAVAFVNGSDNKGYFLRVGDSVYDGTLIAIDQPRGRVTFRQQVDDPRQIKPFRDVVKKLVPLDEEKGDE
jgi:Tfp pilus assembly protein PilP